MKKKLHKNIIFSALALIGVHEIQAQYTGVAYNGVVAQLGVTVGVTVKMEFKNYDASSANASSYGANFDVNTDFNTRPSVETYYDTSASVYSGQTYRTSGDFDIANAGIGRVLENTAPGESRVYTVNLVTPATCHMNVNCNCLATGKSFKILRCNANSSDKTLIYDSGSLNVTTGFEAIANSGAIYFPTAGNWLIRFRIVQRASGNGLQYDYMTFSLDAVLGAEDAQLKVNTLKVYPNPVSNCKFNLNIG